MGVERLTVAGMYNDPLDAMNELKGLPSSFAMGCNGLPHPRSRMALAAETRACAGAFLSSMIFTRVFTACTVCVRAKDLISVIVRCFKVLRAASLANATSERLFTNSVI